MHEIYSCFPENSEKKWLFAEKHGVFFGEIWKKCIGFQKIHVFEKTTLHENNYICNRINNMREREYETVGIVRFGAACRDRRPDRSGWVKLSNSVSLTARMFFAENSNPR